MRTILWGVVFICISLSGVYAQSAYLTNDENGAGITLFLRTGGSNFTTTPEFTHTKYSDTFGVNLGIIFLSNH